MNGLLHLLGGGPGSDARRTILLLREAFARTGAAAPSVACVGAANGDHPRFFRRMSELFMSAGASAFVLAPATGSRRRMAQGRDALTRADAIFLSGGDVAAGMAGLTAAGLTDLLRERHAAGVPFLGSSAGSILLGRQWIAWSDPDDDATAAPFDCLGLAPLLCDTHAEQDEWAELRRLLAFHAPGTRGYGIAANAMLRVYPDGRTEAAGDVVCVGGAGQGPALA